jgi:hypothetical protein
MFLVLELFVIESQFKLKKVFIANLTV